MTLYGFGGRRPDIHPSVFIFPGATIIGDVEIGRDVSVWPGVTIRGDKGPVRIGAGSNIQDHALIHSDPDYPVVVGTNVTVAHSVVLHGCVVGDSTVVGIGAMILNGAYVGERSRVSAGAVVGAGPHFPPASLIAGTPASVLMALSGSDIEVLLETAEEYRLLADQYRQGLKLVGDSAAAGESSLGG